MIQKDIWGIEWGGCRNSDQILIRVDNTPGFFIRIIFLIKMTSLIFGQIIEKIGEDQGS